MLLNTINLMLLLNLILINCLPSFSEDIPIPPLASIKGQCYVKINGNLAKLFKFTEFNKEEKITRYLFTDSNDKMQILHEKAHEKLMELFNEGKFGCRKVENVVELMVKNNRYGFFYGFEEPNYNGEFYVRLSQRDNENRCKAFNAASEMAIIDGNVSQFNVYKCQIIETGNRILILNEMSESELGCHIPNLFIRIGERILRIDVDKYKSDHYNLSTKKRTSLDHNNICYFQSDFDQIQFYKGPKQPKQSRIEHFKNKIVKQKGALAGIGIGCAIGYTFCNLMNRN